MPDVCSVSELKDGDSINCELLLIKLANNADTRDEIMAATTAFEAKIMDYSKDSLILQLTGTSRRIDDFINLMRDFEILEICRTGSVSLEKGSSTIRKVTNL